MRDYLILYLEIIMMSMAWIISSIGALALIKHLQIKTTKLVKIIISLFGVISFIGMAYVFLIYTIYDFINEEE